ncbi:MAG: sugar ABC transporter substrate-binding protein [Bacillota bacterium]
MRRKVIWTVLVAVVSGFLLSGAAAAQEVVLTMWHWETPPHRVRAQEALLQEFYEQTGIRVRQEPINFPDYQRKILSAIAANQLPEMIQVNPPQLMTLLSHRALLPVDELLERLNQAYGFPAPFIEQYRVDGHQYGIPVFGIVWPVQWRKDMLSEVGFANPPSTWDELLTFASKATLDRNNDGRIDIYGFGLPVSRNGNYGSQVVWGFLRSNGGDVVDATGPKDRIIFNSPETVETYRFLANLARYTAPGAENMDWGMGELMLKSGQAAAMVYTGGFLSELDRTNPSLAAQFVTTQLPLSPKGRRVHTGYVRAITVTTAARSPAKQEALRRFLEWLYAPENYARYMMMEPILYVPVTTSVAAEGSPFWKHLLIGKYRQTVETQIAALKASEVIGFTKGHSKNAGALEGAFLLGEVLQKIVIDGWTPEQAIAWGHQRYEEIVAGL